MLRFIFNTMKTLFLNYLIYFNLGCIVAFASSKTPIKNNFDNSVMSLSENSHFSDGVSGLINPISLEFEENSELILSPSVSISTSISAVSPICSGTSLTVTYVAVGVYNPGNVFTAELSNSSGDFSSPTVIGTTTSTSSGTISATIPLLTSSGSGYRIRVVSNSPVIIGSNNGSNIQINATPSITSAPDQSRCGSGTVVLTASASPSAGTTYSWYRASSGGTLVGTGSPYTTPVLLTSIGYYAYYVEATNNGCTSSPRTLVDVNVNNLPTVSSSTGGSRCGTGSVNLSATASAGTINWYTTNAGGSSIGSGSPFATPSISTTTTYYAEASNSGCPSAARSAVTATVNAIPTINSVTGATVCVNGTANLSATASAGTISWFANPSGGSALATGTSFTTPSLPSTTDYYVQAATATCTTASRTSVTATAVTNTTITSVTGDSRCDAGTLNLSATTNLGTISWFANPTGGSSLGTGTTFTTPSISSTTIYYVESNDGTCTTPSRTAVTATITSNPSITSVSGANRCDAGILNLSATASAGTISWYANPTGGTALGSGNTFTTPSISSTTNYYVESVLGSCTSATRTLVVATINTAPTITGVTSASRCGSGTLNLSASASSGTISWFANPTGGVALGSGTTFTTPSISSNTDYYVESVLGSCTTATRTTVTATVNTTPSIIGVSGASRCDNGTLTLSATSSAGTISWFAASTGGIALGTGLTFTTPSISVSTDYFVEAATATCTSSTRTTVTASVTSTPSISSVTGASRCDAGTLTLSATSSGGTISWYASSTGGSAIGTGTTFTTPSISSTTNYFAEVATAACTSSTRSSVTATINTTPSITGVSGASRCDAGTLNLLASSSTGTISWFANPTGGVAMGTGTTFTTPSISSTTDFFVEVATATCTSATRTAVTASISGTLTINSVTGASRCDAGTLTLSASASAGTISWFASSTGGVALGTGSNFTTPSISTTTDYFVEAASPTCTSATRTTVTATVNTTPTITGVTGASRCDAGTVTLSATASAGSISWYDASSGGSLLGTGTSFITPSISSTTNFFAEVATASCTNSSRTLVTATVNITPSISATAGASICDNGAVILSATSTSGTVNWYSSSIGGLILGSGTSFTTPNISSTTNYFAEAATASCTSATRTSVTATVNVTPSIAGVLSSSRCDAGTLSLSASASIGGTVCWYATSTGGGILATGDNFTTPAISSTTNYFVEATTASCTSATRTMVTATVNTTPSFTSVTGASRCDAGTLTLSATTTGGVISWYANPTGGVSLATGTSFTTPSISSSTDYYVEAFSSTCTTATRIIVNAVINSSIPITSSSGGSRCGTGTVNLSASSASGTISWFTSATGGVAIGSGTNFTTPSISATTNYYVEAATATCTTATRTAVTAIVNSLPTISISGTSAICTGASTTLTASGADTYVWTSGPSSDTYTVTPASSTTYTVTGTEIATNCSNTATITVVTSPGFSFSISAVVDSTTCVGATTTLTATGAVSYSWHHNGSLSNIVAVSPITPTYYSVTGTNASGCTAVSSILVSVYTSPPPRPGSITGPSIVCNGSSGNTYSISNVSGAFAYSWNVPMGATITSGQGTNTINVTFGSISGNVSVLATNACGGSSNITRTITVQSVPTTVTTITGSNSLCVNSSNILYTASASTGGTSYNWTVPSGSTIVSGQGTISIVVNFGSTSGNITVTPSNSCYSGSTATRAVTLNSSLIPATATAINGPLNICSFGTSAITYSVANTINTVSYSWVASPGLTLLSGQGTTSIQVSASPSFISGTISEFNVGSCGTSAARTITVSRNVTSPTSISGNNILCGTSSYSVVGAKNATGFSWTVPSGVIINSGQGTNSISVTNSSGSLSGNISVVAYNTCFSGNPVTRAVQGVPSAPASISGILNPCANSSGNAYSVPIVIGISSYSWTVPSGSIITSGQGTRSVNIKFGNTAGNITVTAANSCGSSSSRIRSVTFGCRLSSDGEEDVISQEELSLQNQVYPNPFNNSLNINLVEESKVEILNINGACIKTIKLGAGENELNTLELSSGVYFISISNGDKRTVQKFIKQ
jgi:hypothetical protein